MNGDLEQILSSGDIKNIKIGGTEDNDFAVTRKQVIEAFKGNSNADYIPIRASGRKLKRADIESALADFGITNPRSGMAIFRDEVKDKIWLVYYLKDVDEYRYERLTKAT